MADPKDPRLSPAKSSRKPSPKFFETPSAWRSWLEKHHADQTELLVGFHKKGSGKPSITWPESVDQALCFGWIDGVRRNIDETSYSIRFTPRKSVSTWSVVNMRRVGELMALGLIHPSGRKAFEARIEKRSGIYSFEQTNIAFTSEQEEIFRANSKAWTFFAAQPPGYKRVMTWWVINAKREETRVSRLAKLIEESKAGRRMR
jgi:uncharacterized protein YdeI (YjbR/CyaY-like superfamily)